MAKFLLEEIIKMNKSLDYELYEHSVPGINVFINSSLFNVKIYHGKRTAPTAHKHFNEFHELVMFVDGMIKGQFDRNEEKYNQKKQKALLAAQARQTVQVGDLYFTSWGYDQTNVEFFQVVDRPTPAKATIRQIGKISEDAGYMCANVWPKVNDFIGPEKTCLIDHNANIRNAGNYEHAAYPTAEGKSHYSSWYS